MSVGRRELLLAACGAVSIAVAITLVVTRGGAADDAPAVGAITDPAQLDARGRGGLALVGFDPKRLGYAVRFAPGRPGIRAQIQAGGSAIDVYLRDGDAPHMVAHDIAHELGHAYDQTRMSDSDRDNYLTRRGVPDAAWLPSGDSDYGVGAGDFAEVFALCHAASPDFRGTLAPRPDNACELLPREAL